MKFYRLFYSHPLHIHVVTNFLGHGGNKSGRALQVLLSDSVRIEI